MRTATMPAPRVPTPPQRPTAMAMRRLPPRGTLAQTVRTANAVRAHLERAVLREAQLNWTAFDVLTLACQRQLRGRPGLQIREAVAVVGIAKSTLTIAVQTLIDRQLLRREVNAEDKRRALLRPTNAGLMVAARLQEAIDGEQERLFAVALPGQDSLGLTLRALAARCHDSDHGGAGGSARTRS